MARPLPLSLHDHVVPWRNEDWPVDWARVFGRPAPLVLEIGYGGGEFLEAQALARPERNHLGIELSWTSTTRLLRRLDGRSLTNAKALLIEAEVAVGQLFAPASLAEVFIIHPCPWPKARHGERRLLRPDFLALLASKMEMGAPFTLVTDHADYAEWATEVLEGQDALESCHATTEVDSIPGHTRTRYQAKAEAQGIPIHFFEWHKVRDPHDVLPVPRSDRLDAMPSVTLCPALRTTNGNPSPLKGFTPTTERWTHGGVDTVIRYVTSYAEANGKSWLVESLVVEDRLRQDFAIQVLAQDDGRILIKLAHLARPHPTPGVKRAVWRLAELLVEANPDLRIQHENVGRAIASSPANADDE